MKNKKVLKFYLALVFHCFIPLYSFCHGFDPRIYVSTSISKNRSVPIKMLCEDYLDETQKVCSFDLAKNKCVKSKITAAATAQTNVYVAIRFDNDPSDDIICTPEQEFYTSNKQWMPAHNLKIGDSLFSKDKIPKKISNIRFVKEPLLVYTIRVKKTHTFFVGRNAVLTHNMLLLPFTAGVGSAFGGGAGAGGLAASVLGPVTLAAGLLGGGLIGFIIKAVCAKKRLPHYEISYHSKAFDEASENNTEEEDDNNTLRISQSCGGCPPPDPNDPWGDKKKNKIRKNKEKSETTDEKFRKAFEYATTPRKLEHFFKNNLHDHQFDKLLEQIGGIENIDAQMKIVEIAIKELMKSDCLPAEGKVADLSVQIMGEQVLARVYMGEGIIKLSTLFIPKK